jgi:hypothetical protein
MRRLRTSLIAVRIGFAACATVPAGVAVQSLAASTSDAQGPGVGPQYGSTHVYVAPEDVDRFAQSFLATFGGQSTNPVTATVTPTPSSTVSQILETPVGTVSLFGFRTPIPYPFGSERTGYLVTDLDAAVQAARRAGAAVVVAPFADPSGRDAIVEWPGSVEMQLYWHYTKPSYAALKVAPENRVYVSGDRVDAFVRGWVSFSRGAILSDDPRASGAEIGRPRDTFRRVEIASAFGNVAVFATDGHLPYPYGRETTGYEVVDLAVTLAKARAAGVTVLVEPYTFGRRRAAMVQFPGGYIAEVHASTGR